MTVRTHQFCSQTFSVGGGGVVDELVWATPAGFRTLVKYVSITPFQPANPGLIELYTWADPEFAELVAVRGALAVANHQWVDLYGALEPGEELRLYTEGMVDVDVSVHVAGVLFEL